MFKVELYGRVRRAVLVDGMSQRAVAREFGISRKSVRKMVSFSVPPGYRREQPAARPKLDAFIGVIDAMVEEDKTRPAKQRHTAKRVWERLKQEHQFTGGYTIVKDYLRSATLRYRGNDYSVPTRHGHLQVLVRGTAALLVEIDPVALVPHSRSLIFKIRRAVRMQSPGGRR
jgi:transposase